MLLIINLLYVDPGSGSYLVQLIIAGFLGVLFYFKSLWWKIKAFFKKGDKNQKPNSDEAN
ncbi:MAG TPA: hypothetical protein VKR32_17175 [Puia sp.]|nr:hypothetical protein [Puia sp.]